MTGNSEPARWRIALAGGAAQGTARCRVSKGAAMHLRGAQRCPSARRRKIWSPFLCAQSCSASPLCARLCVCAGLGQAGPACVGGRGTCRCCGGAQYCPALVVADQTRAQSSAEGLQLPHAAATAAAGRSWQQRLLPLCSRCCCCCCSTRPEMQTSSRAAVRESSPETKDTQRAR